jgi:hypothetical protein
MKRIHFLVPDVDDAKELMDSLREAGVPDQHIRLVAKDHAQLEKAGISQETLRKEIGALGGGVGGLISHLVEMAVPGRKPEDLESAIEQGHLLIVIDVPKSRVEDVSELVKKHQNQWYTQLTGQLGPA